MARTDPRDVARVESKTYICTGEKRESIPAAKDGVRGQLGNWMSIEAMKKELGKRFPGCMKGKIETRSCSKTVLGKLSLEVITMRCKKKSSHKDTFFL